MNELQKEYIMQRVSSLRGEIDRIKERIFFHQTELAKNDSDQFALDMIDSHVHQLKLYSSDVDRLSEGLE